MTVPAVDPYCCPSGWLLEGKVTDMLAPKLCPSSEAKTLSPTPSCCRWWRQVTHAQTFCLRWLSSHCNDWSCLCFCFQMGIFRMGTHWVPQTLRQTCPLKCLSLCWMCWSSLFTITRSVPLSLFTTWNCTYCVCHLFAFVNRNLNIALAVCFDCVLIWE